MPVLRQRILKRALRPGTLLMNSNSSAREALHRLCDAKPVLEEDRSAGSCPEKRLVEPDRLI